MEVLVDPDANLARIRQILIEWDSAGNHQIWLGDELVDLLTGLDYWIRLGGYLPAEWVKPHSCSECGTPWQYLQENR